MNNSPSRKIFITGSNSLSEEMLRRIVEEMDLDRGNYALVIRSDSTRSPAIIEFFTEQFSRISMMAVHTMNLDLSTDLKHSDLAMIEGAAVIILSGQSISRLLNSPLKGPLAQALKKAYENYVPLVGEKMAGSMFGEMILRKDRKHWKKGEDRSPGYLLQEGLNILPGFIIDCVFADTSNIDGKLGIYLKQVDQTYIGIPSNGAVYFKNGKYYNFGSCRLIINSPVDSISGLY